MDIEKILTTITGELESQSLNSVVSGFSFAAAIAWMDFVRWAITQVVKINKTSGANYALTAFITTLISVLVFVLARLISKRVVKPEKPVYAIR